MLKKVIFIIFSLYTIIEPANSEVNTDSPKRVTNPEDSPKIIVLKRDMDNGSKKKPDDYEKQIDDLNDKVEDLTEKIDSLKKKIDQLSALQISGFFDVSISNYKNKPNVFALGNFELDLEHNFKENFQVAAALVFFQGAELAVGFIDYHLFGGSISPRGRLFAERGFHIQVGKFDVPFGNDWQNYSAKDRITVTSPLTTEMVLDGGYNDEGARILIKFIPANITLYMVDGIEEKYSFGGNSYGGRIGFTPFNNPYILKRKTIPAFEVGFSYIHDIDNTGSLSEKVYAVDLESKIAPIIIRSEYYKRDKSAGVVFDGFHVTGGIDFSDISALPVIIYGRYDLFRMKNLIPESYTTAQETGEEDKLSRFTAGLNINIFKISMLKAEYQQFLETYEDYEDQYYKEKLYYVQLVITF